MIPVRERATLVSVCGTFVPEADAGAVADAIVDELAAIGRPKLLGDLRLFLRLIDSRLVNAVLVARPVRFSDLVQVDYNAKPGRALVREPHYTSR